MTRQITLPIPSTRREFATAVRRLHTAYLKASHQDAVPRDRRDECELGLETAVSLTQLVAEFDELTPISDIRIGDKATEGQSAARVLLHSRVWDGQATMAVEGLQRALVRRLRGLEQSWAMIGDALGMSGQGASKKAAEKGWAGFLDTAP